MMRKQDKDFIICCVPWMFVIFFFIILIVLQDKLTMMEKKLKDYDYEMAEQIRKIIEENKK